MLETLNVTLTRSSEFHISAHQLKRLLLQAYREINDLILEKHQIEYFSEGLHPDVKKHLQFQRPPKTIEEAIEEAEIYDEKVEKELHFKAMELLLAVY